MEVSPSNRIFTTSQLAQKLGVGPSMARRYGLAFEETTGQSLPQAPGKGRLYPEDVTKALLQARERLLNHPEETVEGALRVVLDLEEPAPERAHGTSQNLEQRLTAQHLEEALTPILEELKALRSDNHELTKQIQALRALPSNQAPEVRQAYENLEGRHKLLLQSLANKDEVIEQLRTRPWWRLW